MHDIPKAIPIAKIIVENPFVKTFVFKHNLRAEPGQFVNLWIPRLDEKPMSVAYSDEKEFWVTMFAVGTFSKAMHEMKVGDLVGVRGPYGNGFTFQKGKRLVMMAGGYGAAPLYFLTSQAIKQKCKVDFVIGARSKEYLLFLSRIKKLKNVTLHVATDDGSVGEKGYNTLILEKLISKAHGGRAIGKWENGKYIVVWEKSKKPVQPIDCVYSCGPELMMKSISDICFANKISAQLSIERYMKCGFGVCGQCCVDPDGERMCKEGPVVDNVRARKISEFGQYHRDKVGRVEYF